MSEKQKVGRKPLPVKTVKRSFVSVRVNAKQKDIFDNYMGADWLREKIEAERKKRKK